MIDLLVSYIYIANLVGQFLAPHLQAGASAPVVSFRVTSGFPWRLQKDIVDAAQVDGVSNHCFIQHWSIWGLLG